jgi:hypothetical protein
MNATDESSSIDIKVTLSQLIPGYRFISVNEPLLTNDTSTSPVLPIDLTVQKNFNPVESNFNEGRRPIDVCFMAGKNQSSLFYVTGVVSRDIDTLRLRLPVMTDYRSIEVFLFHCGFGNSSAEKGGQSAKLLMSFLVGYMLVAFTFTLQFDNEYFIQVFLFVLGVFAANPLNYFTRAAPCALISDHILMSVFITLFRVFVLL